MRVPCDTSSSWKDFRWVSVVGWWIEVPDCVCLQKINALLHLMYVPEKRKNNYQEGKRVPGRLWISWPHAYHHQRSFSPVWDQQVPLSLWGFKSYPQNNTPCQGGQKSFKCWKQKHQNLICCLQKGSKYLKESNSSHQIKHYLPSIQ